MTGGAGVAPVGTIVTIRPTAALEVPGRLGWQAATPGFDIRLGDGSQPSTPVTVTMRIDPDQAVGKSLVFLAQRTGSTVVEGLPVTTRGDRASVTMAHFSGGWFGWVDDANRKFEETVNGYLKLRFDPPPCQGKTPTIGGNTYHAAVNGNGVYVCAEAQGRDPAVSVHSNSPFVWRIAGLKGTVTPAAKNSPLELSGVITIATYHQLFAYLNDREVVLVPGGNSSLKLLGSGPWPLTADTDAGLGLIAIAVTGVDVYLSMAGITLAAREKAAIGECAAGILEANTQPDAGKVTRAVIDCFGTAVKGPAAIVVAIVSSLASLLVTQIVGLAGEITRTNHLAITVSATPTNPSAAVTAFVTVKRWSGTEFVTAKAEPAIDGDSCVGSEIAPRSDGFRCFHGNGVFDPCFAHPTNPGEYACRLTDGTPLRITGMPPPLYSNDGQPGSTAVYQVDLANGATCHRATGAGPPGLPGYPAWVGACTGGPYGSNAAIWRVGDDAEKGSRYPLYATSTHGQFAAAVEVQDGHVERVPVKTAYR